MKQKLYKIESGVKLPPPAKGIASIRTSAVAATLAILERGQSFLIKDALEAIKATKVMRDFCSRERARDGKNARAFTSRKVGNGVRIWRVK